MFFGPIIFTAVLVLIVYVLVRSTDGKVGFDEPPHKKTPLEILKERFARGELDRREYDERRRTLEHS